MQKLLKNSWQVFLFLLLLVLALLILFHNSNSQSLNEKFQERSALKELSKEDYQKIRDKYIDLLNLQNPRISLDQLREDIKLNDLLSRSCHILVHELGHAAYAKYKDFAQSLKYQDEVCNSGFLHGVIEAQFKESEDIFESLKSVCSQYKSDTFLGWECFHGVGHGLMYYTANDLAKSVELCESFRDVNKTSFCVNGVFMENFATDQKLHPSRFLRVDNPFYPCFEQKEKYKDDCYVYAPTYFLTLHKNAYSEALIWCKTADKTNQLVCTEGVGSQTIKENINSPLFAEGVCMSADKDQILPCITGMVNLYINHFGSLDPAIKLCTQLQESNKRVCEKVIQLRSTMF